MRVRVAHQVNSTYSCGERTKHSSNRAWYEQWVLERPSKPSRSLRCFKPKSLISLWHRHRVCYSWVCVCAYALLTSISRVVVGNWKREIQNWCPSLRVVLYHGAQAERAKLRKSMVQSPPNVIITTYSVAFRKQDRLFFKKRLNFSYLVLGTLSRDTFAAVSTDRLISISVSHIRLDLSDEAQSVKNAESIRHRFLTKFSSERRLLLTGTPLQNNMTELWALLEFLMPDIFARFRKKNPVRVNQ